MSSAAPAAGKAPAASPVASRAAAISRQALPVSAPPRSRPAAVSMPRRHARASAARCAVSACLQQAEARELRTGGGALRIRRRKACCAASRRFSASSAWVFSRLDSTDRLPGRASSAAAACPCASSVRARCRRLRTSPHIVVDAGVDSRRFVEAPCRNDIIAAFSNAARRRSRFPARP